MASVTQLRKVPCSMTECPHGNPEAFGTVFWKWGVIKTKGGKGFPVTERTLVRTFMCIKCFHYWKAFHKGHDHDFLEGIYQERTNG